MFTDVLVNNFNYQPLSPSHPFLFFLSCKMPERNKKVKMNNVKETPLLQALKCRLL